MFAVYTTKSRTYEEEYLCTDHIRSIVYSQEHNDHEQQLDRNYTYLLSCHAFATSISSRINDMLLLTNRLRCSTTLLQTHGIYPMTNIAPFLHYLETNFTDLKIYWRTAVDGLPRVLELSRLLELVGMHFQCYIHAMIPKLNSLLQLLHFPS